MSGKEIRRNYLQFNRLLPCVLVDHVANAVFAHLAELLVTGVHDAVELGAVKAFRNISGTFKSADFVLILFFGKHGIFCLHLLHK